MQRRTLLATAGATAFSLVSGQTRASSYPDRPIRLVVPFQPGSGPDGLARVVAEGLSAGLGQTVVVENAPGAGGVIGAMALKRAAPDGYTIGLFANTHVINVHTFRNMPYHTARDFTPIGALVTNATVLAVPVGSPYKSAGDLVDAMKRAPGTLNYGSGGKGSIAHLAVELLLQQTGTQAVHVPYKGAVDIVTAMLSGQTQFGMPTMGVSANYLRNGQIRVLAVASGTRTRLLPDVPTLAEVLPPGVRVDNWSGLFAPAHLPEAVTQRLFREIAVVQGSSRYVDFMKSTGADVMRSESPRQFAGFVATELDRFGKLMRSIGMEPTT
ncbi:MAG: Bug family tripartite tricarboxylate transporter substrate binding protein [Cupriavidus necator]